MIQIDLDYEKIHSMVTELNNKLNRKVFKAVSVVEIDTILDETDTIIEKMLNENGTFSELGQVYSLLRSSTESIRKMFHPYYQKKHY